MIQVALVAACKRERALPERRVGSGIVVLEILLDDAVEHRDQGRALAVQRLRHLRAAHSAQVGKRVAATGVLNSGSLKLSALRAVSPHCD